MFWHDEEGYPEDSLSDWMTGVHEWDYPGDEPDDDNDYPVYIDAPDDDPTSYRPAWFHVPHLDSQAPANG